MALASRPPRRKPTKKRARDEGSNGAEISKGGGDGNGSTSIGGDKDRYRRHNDTFQRLAKTKMLWLAAMLLLLAVVGFLCKLYLHVTAVSGAETKSTSSGTTKVPSSFPSQEDDADGIQSLLGDDLLYPFYKEISPSPSSSMTTMTTLPTTYQQQQPLVLLEPKPFPTVEYLENCTLQHEPPLPRTDESTWRKPLWAPSYPSSGGSTPSKLNGGGDLIKTIVEHLTGRTDDKYPKINPVKNYHMSIRNKLRRCKGVSETILCTQGHPLVPVEPHKQTSNFQRPVILPIRNIASAFHTSLNDKAVAYHGSKGGQIDYRHWIETRDQYVNGTVTSWIALIHYWLGTSTTTASEKNDNNTYYHIGLFLPWEDLMDVSPLSSSTTTTSPLSFSMEKQSNIIQQGRGPQLVHKLAQTLVSLGYDDGTIAASIQDATCVWYQVVKREWLRQQTDMKMTYLPTFTNEQIDYIILQMEQLLKQQEQYQQKNSRSPKPQTQVLDDSPSLIPILKRYLQQLQQLKKHNHQPTTRQSEESK